MYLQFEGKHDNFNIEQTKISLPSFMMVIKSLLNHIARESPQSHTIA